MNKNNSKFLSLVLRHKPDTIKIKLDKNGWANVDELLIALKKAKKDMSMDQLREVVEHNDKKRFELFCIMTSPASFFLASSHPKKSRIFQGRFL